MVLRHKCFIANLDSEKGPADRRSGDGTVRAAFRCPRGEAARWIGVSGGGSANISTRLLLSSLTRAICSRGSIAVSRLPVFTTLRILLDNNVLCVSTPTLALIAGIGAIMWPLLFASLQPELAEAKGVSLRLVSMLFLTIAALAVAACSHIVGVLLVFTPMVSPAAAKNLTLECPQVGLGE
jgi:ABC-type Mn2+/Zn2+ transport system permease subunit